MTWEDRKGGRYYYRKRREGKRVVSEYVGGGAAGELAAIFDTEDKLEAQQIRAALQQQKASAKAIDNQVSLVEKYTRAVTRGVLLLSGYHSHKRQWRKRRYVRRSNQNND